MNNSLVLAIMIGGAVLVVLGAVIAIYIKSKNKNDKTETDFRVFFILGISFLPIGIATDNPGLWGMGAVFLILGLVNRDKWKAEPKWSDLDPEKRKRIVFFIILGLAMLLALGVVLFLIARSL
jgi:predicted membrane channel-forming protein YqfA (hemolysin III family)